MRKRLLVIPLIVVLSTFIQHDDKRVRAADFDSPAWAESSRASDLRMVTIESAIHDMKKPHDSRPAGVPGGYDWADKPTVHAGNKIPANFTAITGFGEIQFATDSSVSAARDIVMLRHFKTYILTRSNSLEMVQSSDILDGGQFNPDFQGNVNTPPEMSNSGGETEVVTIPGKAFQFWPRNKANIDPSALNGVIVTVEAKIKPQINQIDPDINTRYILALGADYWRSFNSTWDNYKSSAGVGTGRFAFLTTSWRCYTFTSIRNADPAVLATSFAC